MLIDRIYEDVRAALRLIAGNRTLSLAVFISLALGIGASTSMFGFVDTLLFRPLPVPQTDKVLRVTSVNPASAVDEISYPDFEDLRKRASVFETLATTRDDAAAIQTHTGS